MYAGENKGGTIASYTCLGRNSVEKFKKHFLNPHYRTNVLQLYHDFTVLYVYKILF